MKLKYNIELKLNVPELKENNLNPSNYLIKYSGMIRHYLEKDSEIKNIEIRGIFEL